MLRAAQNGCGKVVDEVGSSGGAVQQPGGHILEALGQADASGSTGLPDLPLESPMNVMKEIVSKQMLDIFIATMCEYE